MKNSIEHLAFLAALAGCASQEAPKASSPPSTPNWVKEECIRGRAELIRAIAEAESSGDKKLQTAIDRVKRVCGITPSDASDVLHVVLEDIAEDQKRQLAADTSATPTCQEMLDVFDKVPTICGVPDISVLIEKCGLEEETGVYHGIGHLHMLGSHRDARWPFEFFDVKEDGESIQAACEISEIRRQTIVRLSYEGRGGMRWLWATPFFMKEDDSVVEKTVYYWDRKQGPIQTSRTGIPCPPSEIQRLFRNRLCQRLPLR